MDTCTLSKFVNISLRKLCCEYQLIYGPILPIIAPVVEGKCSFCGIKIERIGFFGFKRGCYKTFVSALVCTSYQNF